MQFSPLILYSNQNAEISKFSALKLKKIHDERVLLRIQKTHYLANTIQVLYLKLCVSHIQGFAWVI